MSATTAVPTNGIDAEPANVPDATHTADHDATPPAASTAQKSSRLGPLIHMRPLTPKDLPSHASLSAHQITAEQPRRDAFLNAVLTEGHDFITHYLPKHFAVKSKSKSSPPSAAPVDTLAHEIRAAELPVEARTHGVRTPTENWFARSSTHENAAAAGTASWEEFDMGLRHEHSRNEAAYTPSLKEAHEVLSFASEGAASEVLADGWSSVDARIFEMVHELPGPLLSDRVFSVLVVSGRKGEGEFVDVQIPVDLRDVAEAKYRADGKKTAGVYCSVEYGHLLDGGKKVLWQMATASNAGGVLPMAVQKMALPGAIAKDVGLFIGWCEQRRKGGK